MKNFIILNKLKSLFGTAKASSLAEPNHSWDKYNDGAVGRPLYYLYSQALIAMPSHGEGRQALELGAGAGDIVVDLLKKGFEVTAIDDSLRSDEIIMERVKHFDNKLHFQRIDFQHFETNDHFDLVISLFSLPFLPKDKLSLLIPKLSQCMKNGAILVFNLFAGEHTWVKHGLAYGISKEELMNLLKDNDLKLDFFLNRVYDQAGNNGPIHWDIYDIIAVKN